MNHPSRTFSVKVPTKTYLRKYLQAMYAEELLLHYRSDIGTFILSTLTKETHDVKLNAEDIADRLSKMTDTVTFAGSLGTMDYKGHTVDPEKIIAINRFLEQMFVKDMHLFCATQKRPRAWRPGISDAIYAFAEGLKLELPEDTTFDALKKAESRYRKKLEQKFVGFVPLQNRPMQIGYFGGYGALAM